MPMQPHAPHFGLILPLCTSSATVGLSLYQYPVFMSFLQSEPSIAGKPLSRYWEPFMKYGGAYVTGVTLTSALSGIVSMRWLHTHGHLETTEVAKWYGYGSLFAVLHFAVAPLLMKPIKKMQENGADGGTIKTESEIEESNTQEMKTWLQWHLIRTVVIDLPALWCFAEGAAMSFWVI